MLTPSYASQSALPLLFLTVLGRHSNRRGRDSNYMSVAPLQRRLLQHLYLPGQNISLSVPVFCRRRNLISEGAELRVHVRFLFGRTAAVQRRETRGVFKFDHASALGCRCDSGFHQNRRIARTPSTAVTERKSDMEQKGTVRRRSDGVPKQLALRPNTAHGNTTISYIQILGTGMDTGDTSPSVLLFFDKRRFIFNAGEGLQRFCIEHKIKLSKLDHVFLTRICSETASGLPGLLLTLANIGEVGMAVNLWGPSDLKFLVDAMRTFVPSSSVVHTHSFGEFKHGSTSELSQTNLSETHSGDLVLLLEDDVVKISAILLRPELSGSAISKSDGKSLFAVGKNESKVSNQSRSLPPTPGQSESSAKALGSSIECAEPWELGFERDSTPDIPADPKRLHVESPVARKSQGTFNVRDMDVNPTSRQGIRLAKSDDSQPLGDIAVVYVCELPDVAGKFDPVKAKAMGLRPGPKYGQLQSGRSVLADDGKSEVHPSDVMDPSSAGPICLIVDCPTAAHVSSLLSSPSLKLFHEGGSTISKKVDCLVHIGPASTIKDLRYQQWMTKFEGSQHIMAGHGMLNNVSPILKSSARIFSRLNLVCPQVFPIPGTLQDDQRENRIYTGSREITIAENLLKFRLRPLSVLGVDRSAVPEPFNFKQARDQLLKDIPELLEASQKIANIWNAMPNILAGSTASEVKVFGDSMQQEISSQLTEEPWVDDRIHLGGDYYQQGPDPGSSSLIYSPLEQSECSELLKCKPSVAMLEEHFPQCLLGVSREDMEIVFLGTGSSQPSKYRNVSAIYIHLFKQGGILLDCGEGTYAQLKRRYGLKAADEVVASLKCVWISHIHADHHTGLARILSVRKKLLQQDGTFNPILVVGPKQLKRYLEAYEKLEDLGMDFLDCSQTTTQADAAAGMHPGQDSSNIITTNPRSRGGSPESGRVGRVSAGLVRPYKQRHDFDKGITSTGHLRNYWLQSGFHLQTGLDNEGRKKLQECLLSMGLASLTSIPVVHCPHAFGIVLESQGTEINDAVKPGWKLVYSGDTRPCRELMEASIGATVLIHEATFDDGMPDEAIGKNHSLTREAIEIGIKAGVYRTILTHFSQRYPKIPVFNESYTDRTCIAFDMMSANLADLHLLPKLLPALKLLFKDDLMIAEEEGVDEVMMESLEVISGQTQI